MIKHLFAFFLCSVLATTSFAQTSNYWVCKEPLYADKSQSYLYISQIELTPEYTIVSFAIDNRHGGETFITACNSFKLMYKGKKVAKLVKTSNIPIQDVIKKPFECADIRRARKVSEGQRVNFKLYFTPIPKEADYIDIIEYNGTQSCEFDVYKIDIRRKTPTKADQLPEPIAQRAEKKPAVKAPSIKTKPDKKPSPPIVDNSPKPDPKPKPNPTEASKEVTVTTKKVTMEIWDNDVEDGDIVSLSLNGKQILERQEVKKEKYKIVLDLKKGENTFEMTAIDAGKRGPYCTAAFLINDGADEPQKVILQAETGKSQTLKITVE